MIGLDQEPNRETLDALNAALGEGKYQLSYEQGPNGVKAIVSTREKPARTWSGRFAASLAREQVDAVWQELASRVGRSAGTTVPEPEPDESGPPPINNSQPPGEPESEPEPEP